MRSTVAPALVSLLLLTLPAAATAGQLRMEFRDGYVSISAADVPLRELLTEWARLGRTRVINAEKVSGGPLTLELSNVPEKQALDIILRTVPGYLAAQRTTAVPGGSQFDRIVVMPGTVAPPSHTAASAPPPPPPPPMHAPVPAMVEDQDQPVQEPPDRAEQPEQPEQPEQAEQAEPAEQDQQPQPTGQTLPQPGFQPMPQNPPGTNNQGAVQQQPPGPVASPGHGAIVTPTPGQLPAPPPPKPQDQQEQQQDQ